MSSSNTNTGMWFTTVPGAISTYSMRIQASSATFVAVDASNGATADGALVYAPGSHPWRGMRAIFMAKPRKRNISPTTTAVEVMSSGRRDPRSAMLSVPVAT